MVQRPHPGPLLTAAAHVLSGRQPLATVAREAGFDGVTPLAAAFAREFHVQPRALQQWGSAHSYRIDYGGPYNVEQVLGYLGRDPDNLAERVDGRTYTRFFPVEGHALQVTLTFAKSACTVQAPRPRSVEAALALHLLLKRFLGLGQPLPEFYRLVRGHRVFGPLVKAFPGARIPQLPSLWEALCWAVVGQQINLAFAYKLRNRLIALGNGVDAAEALQSPVPLTFPSPEQVLRVTREALLAQQFSRQKAAYVLSLAQASVDGLLDEATLRAMDPEEAEEALMAQKGVGPWSAAYALMRSLGHPDALPVGDSGLRAALKRQFRLKTAPDVKRQIRLMEPFRPYRSLATYYLWKSLSVQAGN